MACPTEGRRPERGKAQAGHASEPQEGQSYKQHNKKGGTYGKIAIQVREYQRKEMEDWAKACT